MVWNVDDIALKYFYFALGGGQTIATSGTVRMFVCLSACISKQPHVQTLQNF